MQSYDLGLFYFIREGLNLHDDEKNSEIREEIDQKEREWQSKWYKSNHNGIEVS